ncbi:uncharacterized protein LOC111518920 [Drosophila willistoni]|uniref:uncharacterized protein LOC111518920 n=1 Tax=Drosophila willistoni TaxID=7260 RepID=UPI001F072564|nr:uncharacterized protein LOC111518920 [Drosophila willistoni]
MFSLREHFLQLTIALLGIGLPVAKWSRYWLCFVRTTRVLQLGQAIEMTASILLLFGILKAEAHHKAPIILIWLFATLIYFSTIIYNMIDYENDSIYAYQYVVTALIALMMYINYGFYIKISNMGKEIVSATAIKAENKLCSEENDTRRPLVYEGLSKALRVEIPA